MANDQVLDGLWQAFGSVTDDEAHRLVTCPPRTFTTRSPVKMTG